MFFANREINITVKQTQHNRKYIFLLLLLFEWLRRSLNQYVIQ